MKKLLFFFVAVVLCASATAQQYVVVNDELPIPASDIEKITYEQNNEFHACFLPNILADDPKTQLFSQALKETGLNKTLCNYIYEDYQAPDVLKYRYKSHTWTEVAWYNAERYKMFTLFVETDDVLAAQGITNLDQLKAYAKQVYDEAYPEDVDVSNPKDPRNSLNRFVAYHILPFGSTYWYLTFYDGKITNCLLDTEKADMAIWYATLMPHASLKCSYPMAGDDSGIYLNRRGLKDGPDKYGMQVRGPKVVPDDSNHSDPFTQKAFNGYYFYIDRILTYDRTTQEMLGSELWRVDFKALSPDIMNNADELRGDAEKTIWDGNVTDELHPYPDGRSFIYKWDSMENITGENMDNDLIALRTSLVYAMYLGDDVAVQGDGGTLTIKLPPLPAGEWEIRLGFNTYSFQPTIKIYLNGQVTVESLNLSQPEENQVMRVSSVCRVYGGNLSEDPLCTRCPLGRILTDGKSDSYLKLEYMGNTDTELRLDYLELVPKAVYDNKDIPEE